MKFPCLQRGFVDQDVATELAYYHQLSSKNMTEKIMVELGLFLL